MNTPVPADLLEELLLRVARRADQLAARSDRPTGLNRECWLLAEAEILPFLLSWEANLMPLSARE